MKMNDQEKDYLHGYAAGLRAAELTYLKGFAAGLCYVARTTEKELPGFSAALLEQARAIDLSVDSPPVHGESKPARDETK